MERGAELTLVNASVDVQVGDVGLRSFPDKVDVLATVEPFRNVMRESRSCCQRRNMPSINLS